MSHDAQITLVKYEIYISVTTRMEFIIIFYISAALNYLSRGEQVHGGILAFQLNG